MLWAVSSVIVNYVKLPGLLNSVTAMVKGYSKNHQRCYIRIIGLKRLSVKYENKRLFPCITVLFVSANKRLPDANIKKHF